MLKKFKESELGVTILEVTITIALTLVILASIGGIAQSVFAMNKSNTAAVKQNLTTTGVTNTFAADVEKSRASAVSADKRTLRLTMNDGKCKIWTFDANTKQLGTATASGATTNIAKKPIAYDVISTVFNKTDDRLTIDLKIDGNQTVSFGASPKVEQGMAGVCLT